MSVYAPFPCFSCFFEWVLFEMILKTCFIPSLLPSFFVTRAEPGPPDPSSLPSYLSQTTNSYHSHQKPHLRLKMFPSTAIQVMCYKHLCLQETGPTLSLPIGVNVPLILIVHIFNPQPNVISYPSSLPFGSPHK